MRFFSIASVLVGASAVSAQSLMGLPLDIATLLSSLKPASDNDPRFMDFHPPGTGDVRSPCPALNSTAAIPILRMISTDTATQHLPTTASSTTTARK